MKKIAVALAVFMLFGTVTAWAQCCPFSNWIKKQAESDSYPEKFVGLLADGVHRVVQAPIEVLYHPYDEIVNQDQRAIGFFTGLGKGILWGAHHIIVGAVNIISAPVPGAKGYLAPHSHVKPCESESTTA
ncbi:MAG: hypothetical protein HYS55_04735 [Candidatus Omnitrophica bacterium]|nr:hypothetical protein [Candidatus Omnitrophota bacterium]